jgi:hypothetical protein
VTFSTRQRVGAGYCEPRELSLSRSAKIAIQTIAKPRPPKKTPAAIWRIRITAGPADHGI